MRFVNTSKCHERGYVALEFALGMGLLVLPTALILLQIPTYLEQHDRVSAIAATVSQACAARAESIEDGQRIATQTASEELISSTSLSKSSIRSASCKYEDDVLVPGTVVQSTISIDVPGAIIPGLPQNTIWTMTESHSSVIPKYRSVEES